MKEYKEYDDEKLLEGDEIRKTYGFNNKYEEYVGSMQTNEEIYKMAKKRVAMKQGFIIHFAAYLIANFIVFMTAGPFVTMLVLASWGIGIAAHGISVSFFLNRQRLIAREMRSLEEERNRR